MSESELLAQRFEAERAHLRSVAWRMLGSGHEADDAVQEAWLRLSRSGADSVENLGGWLTTVVARVCLDMLRSRATKREAPPEDLPERSDGGPTPEDEAVLADSVGVALLVVLDTLEPAERLAFVLHDMFAVPFDEIAPIVGRTPVATRQLASRARRRVQSDRSIPESPAAAQREVVMAFLAAARQGDFEGLMRLLHPDAVMRADATAGSMGPQSEWRGRDEIAGRVCGGAKVARPVLIDGLAGWVWSRGGQPHVVFSFIVDEGRIVRVDLLGDPETLAALELEPLES